MALQTTVSLDATVYRAIESRVGPEGVSDFVNEALSRILDSEEADVCPNGAMPGQVSEGYFETFTETGRTIAEMAASTRKRLALLRNDLQRADFPPHVCPKG